jgi:hypothetical protein
VRDPHFETPDRSMAFFSRTPSRAESSMTAWAAIALLLVLVAIAIGGTS